MLIKQTNTALSSLGYELDCREEAFGYLRDSSDVLGQPEQLRRRMQQDGYLYLKAFLNSQVLGLASSSGNCSFFSC